jgi:hypothetical protein
VIVVPCLLSNDKGQEDLTAGSLFLFDFQVGGVAAGQGELWDGLGAIERLSNQKRVWWEILEVGDRLFFKEG